MRRLPPPDVPPHAVVAEWAALRRAMAAASRRCESQRSCGRTLTMRPEGCAIPPAAPIRPTLNERGCLGFRFWSNISLCAEFFSRGRVHPWRPPAGQAPPARPYDGRDWLKQYNLQFLRPRPPSAREGRITPDRTRRNAALRDSNLSTGCETGRPDDSLAKRPGFKPPSVLHHPRQPTARPSAVAISGRSIY
jgi:hypothetical protein